MKSEKMLTLPYLHDGLFEVSTFIWHYHVTEKISYFESVSAQLHVLKYCYNYITIFLSYFCDNCLKASLNIFLENLS